MWHHRANDDSINNMTNQSELKTKNLKTKRGKTQVGVAKQRNGTGCTGMTRRGTGLSRSGSRMPQNSV